MTYASEVLADSPVLYWRLGESSGTVANDSSGNGRHGTYNGSPTLGVAGLVDDSDTAIQCDGIDDDVVATGLSLGSGGNWSIECWFKRSGAPPANKYVFWVDGGPASTDGRLGAYLDSGGTLRTHVTTSSYGGGVGPNTGINCADGNRHQVVITWQGGASTDCRVYVDGAQVATNGYSGTIASLANAYVAAQGSFGSRFDGVVDEFSITASTLSAARVLARYQAGTAAPPAANEVVLSAEMPPVVGNLGLEKSRVANLDATMPPIESSIALIKSREVALDATMPPVVGALMLDNVGVSSLLIDATMPSIVGSLALQGVVVEAEVNRAGAWVRDNIGEAQWEPAIAPPVAAIYPQQIVAAQAYTAPVIDGTQVLVEPTYATAPMHRDRILIAGRDITYLRDAPTPTPDWQLVQPLLWGAATIELPQIAVPFEQPGHGALTWLKPGAPVIIQRVDNDTNEVVATDYRGLVIAFGLNGGNLTVECGGHATGRASLIDRQPRLIQQRVDAGTLCARAIKQIRLKHNPPLRKTTGIELIDWGGGGMLDYINELVGKMTTVDGDQWTLMPDSDAVYRTTLRDTTTIHGTVYLDDARIKGDLRRDLAEEPNRIFASGVTPGGMVVKFGAYPGLIQTAAPPYPFDNNATFGVGTTDGDTDTGDGITVMGWRLFTAGYLDGQVSYSTFTTVMGQAIRELRRDAGLANTNTMNPAAWRALFDLSVTGYDLRNIRVLPAAQDPKTKPWRLSASGGLIARNPSYDASVPWSDRTIDMGAGYTRSQIRQWSRTELADGPVWRGTIEINTGAIINGNHTPGDPIASIRRARSIKPGMNLRLPLFAGGITVHVAGVSFTNGGRTCTLAVATQPGDTLPVWAAIQRDRDSRNTVHRSFFQQRRTTALSRENTFDEVGGTISPIRLNGGNWTVFPVVAKQAGYINRIRLSLSPAREFVVAVFGRRISPARLRRVTNAPLSNPGRKRWTEDNVYNRLNRDHVVLYVAGSDEDPCGYFPGRKTDGGNLTGDWDDEAGFPFVTFSNDTDRGSVLWVGVWVPNAATLQGGRIMWPSAEDY